MRWQALVTTDLEQKSKTHGIFGAFTMRFILMFGGPEPAPDETACKQDRPEVRKLIGELKDSGILLFTEGLESSEKGARVRLEGSRYSVTDGPFAEAKELVAGVAIVKASSKQEAMSLARRFLEAAGGGVGEVREIKEMKM
jgi:hypothetical protein